MEREVGSGKKLQVRGGGRLVMGQDIDSLEGSLNVRQAMHGDVADFILYPYAFDSEALMSYVKCGQLESNSVKTIFSFNTMTKFKVLGSTRVSQISLDDICNQEFGTMIMIAEKMNFQSSYTLCSKIKGRLAVPETAEENAKIFDEFLIFNDLCVDAYGTLYWLGIKGDLVSGQWLVLPEKNPLGWSNLVSGFDEVKATQQCASVGGADFPLDWFSTPCDYLSCPLCTFPHTPAFRVRGLCSDSLIDQTLYLRDYKNDKIQFHGPYYTVIEWDLFNMTWKLTSRGHEDLSGYMVLERPGDIPVGVHTWDFSGDNCLITKVTAYCALCQNFRVY